MMNVLLLGYIAILGLFVWLGLIPFNRFWKFSPLIVALALVVGLFIPMGWGAPSGAAVVARNSVQVVPSVSGEVLEVPVVANTPLREGDVLFRIDPTTYQAQVAAIEAQLKFAELRLSQYTQLQRADSGRAFDVQQHESEVDQLKAQLDGAKWNLDKTTVRAPADGYVTNLALRKGARVTAQSPVMAFIDTSETIFAVAIPRSIRVTSRTGSRSRSRSRPCRARFIPVASRQYCKRLRAVRRRPAALLSRRRTSTRRRSSSASSSTMKVRRDACRRAARGWQRSSPTMSR
jgi:multidrug efflux pump subunit AcrA (membrane-fusion protein)